MRCWRWWAPKSSSPSSGQVRADSPAAAAGLKSGDEIVRVGDYKVEDTEELQIDLLRQVSGEASVPMRVKRGADELAVTLHLADDTRPLTEPGKLLPGLGFDLATWRADTLVQSVPAGSAGDRAGLKSGDKLLSVDGRPIVNSSDFIGAVTGAPGGVLSDRGSARGRAADPLDSRAQGRGGWHGDRAAGHHAGRGSTLVAAGPRTDRSGRGLSRRSASASRRCGRCPRSPCRCCGAW